MKNKAILMSIRPQYVAKILNGEKTIEVRKKFPKDYVGWVYIYCTKGNGCLDYDIEEKNKKWFWWTEKDYKNILPNVNKFFNGKVVARFWCDKVEEIAQAKLDTGVGYDYIYDTDTLLAQDFVKKCCLDNWDLLNYFGYKYPNGEIVGCAIHITRLEVFDKPKELKEFRHTCKAEYRGYNCWQPCSKECKNCICNQIDDEGYSQCFSRLTKAPESWYYIEEK